MGLISKFLKLFKSSEGQQNIPTTAVKKSVNMTIAIIAHDGKKAEMVGFVKDHVELFNQKKIHLIATGTTGSHLERAGLEVEKMQSGPVGGDAQIASRMVEGKIDMVIFFRDPLGKHPHEVDVNMLMRIADVYNIPLATNPAAAKRFVDTL
jgi:methylglyoxal synthase